MMDVLATETTGLTPDPFKVTLEKFVDSLSLVLIIQN
jgi:hypothetical protein